MSQSHGWLIAACFFWIVYEAASCGPVVHVQSLSHRIWSVVAATLIWLLAIAANLQIVHQVMLPVIALSAVYSLYGWSTSRHYVFAFAYMYFAMAIWAVFNAPLQWATVYAMRLMVRLVGIPAYLHENFIELPSGLLVVEGGCSGLNFFVVALALASLYAYLNSIRRWWALLVLGAVLAIFANWARVLTIIVAAHLTDMQHYLVRVDHIRFGWVVFATVMVLFFVIANRMETTVVKPPPAEPPVASNADRRWTYAMVLAALLVGPIWYWVAQSRSDDQAVAKLLPSSSDWRLDPPSSDWIPLFEGADAQFAHRWSRDIQHVDTFQATYFSQSQDAKLAGWTNSILGSLEAASVTAPIIARPAMSQIVARDEANGQWLIWHRYTAGVATFATARRAQALAGLRSLVIPTRASVEAWRAPCRPDCAAAARVLDQFVIEQ